MVTSITFCGQEVAGINRNLILCGNKFPEAVILQFIRETFYWYVVWILVCHKNINMKSIAVVLIVLGLVMIVFRGFNFQTEKKVVDIGPVEINRKENKWVGWPTYAGAIAIAGGVLLLVGTKKK